MKKLFRILYITVLSFCFTLSVNAEACDQHPISLDNLYNETGWDTYAFKCTYNLDDCVDKWSACSMTSEGDAASYCERTYQSKEYKGGYHTSYTGKCDTSQIYRCLVASATCNYQTWISGYYDSCSDGDDGCNCKPASCPEDKPDCDIVCEKWIEGYWEDTSEDYSYTTPSDVGLTDLEAEKNKIKSDWQSKCDKLYDSSLDNLTFNENYKVTYKSCPCTRTLFRVDNVREAKYSTKGDKGDTIPVYCINPGDDAPEGSHGEVGKPGSNRQIIDATKCVDSYSTPECGFSNILIEGYYRANIMGISNYDYAVIGAAMRLWSAHVGGSGFNDTGIADEDDSTIGNKTWLKFVPGDDKAFKDSYIKYQDGLTIFNAVNKNNWVNVFKATLYYFENMNYYKLVSSSSIRDLNTTDDEGINDLTRIACSWGLIGVFCLDDLNTGDYVYALSLYANTLQGNDLMQEHLDEINKKNNPDAFVDTSNNYPEGFTTRVIDDNKIEITYRLEETVNIDCNTLDEDTANDIGCEVEQVIKIKDSTGKEVGSANIDKYDYCQKNYCYAEIDYDLKGVKICEKVTDVTITTEVMEDCGAKSVKRYYSCANPSDHQVMYSFEPDNCGTKTFETINSVLNCNSCSDEAKIINNSCSLNDNDFDKPVINSLEEPSLNCILHKNYSTSSATTKNDYDYSDFFQVNTDICRVYCSDKLTYNMSGRKNVASSFQLKYDINKDLNPSLSSTNNLISIIQVERECVSHIFYEDDIDSKKLEVAYGLSEEFIKDWEDNSGKEEYIDIHNGMIDDWKELYGLLVAKSSEENFRTEVLNKLVYDLYNCNFLNLNSLPSGVEKPVDSVNSMNLLNELYNQTFNDCEANPESCFNGYINYEGGTEYIHPENSLTRVGESVNNPGLSAKFYKHHTDYGLLYCNGHFCFNGEVDGKYEDDFDSRYWKNSVFSNEVFSKLYDDFNDTKGLVDILNVPVPTNDYVKFSIKGSIEIINNVKYQVEPATGKVQTEKDDKKDIYHTLPDNTFPVSSNAYNLCEYTDPYDSSIKIKGICDVNHNYNFPKFFNYSANSIFKKATFNENFNREVEKLNSFNCNYKVNCISGDPDTCVGYIHRNIDLANPVPVEREGTNWDSTNSNDLEYSSYVNGVISEIKESSNDNLYATDEYLEYSFVLSPTAIDEIRTDNKMYGYYQLPINCSKTDDGRYANCQSEFLNKIRDDNSSFSIVVNKDDGVSKFTENKNRPGGGE